MNESNGPTASKAAITLPAKESPNASMHRFHVNRLAVSPRTYSLDSPLTNSDTRNFTGRTLAGPSNLGSLPHSQNARNAMPAGEPLNGSEAPLALNSAESNGVEAPQRRLMPFGEPKRRPASTLLPRHASGSPSFVPRISSDIPPSSPLAQGDPAVFSDRPRTQSANDDITAWEFLQAEPRKEARAGDSSHPVRSSTMPLASAWTPTRRAEVPIMELRVIPVGDTINMFGSTQTSSNYSLSGKVVVSVRNVIRSDGHGQGSGKLRNRAQNGATAWLPEIITDVAFLDAESVFARTLTDVGDDSDELDQSGTRIQEIKVLSLRCTFIGYAHYVDHSGRFSACKLTELSEELLPNGYTISIPEPGKSAEYEIEFNLSVPGWLPSSLLTRFGGTFYSLEAKVKYTAIDSEQQHAIPSSLVPPRRGSRPTISPTEDYDSDDQGRDASSRWQRPQNLSDEEQMRISSARHAKERSDSTPLTSSSKGTWLSKRAKQLASKTKARSNATSPVQSSGLARSSSYPFEPVSFANYIPPKMYASKGYIRAFSDPVVIVVRRCREVVPVPVARVALVGPQGSVDGAIQDPPVLQRQTSRYPELDTQAPTATAQSDQSDLPGPPVAPTTFDTPLDPAKAAAHTANRPPNAPQRTSSATAESEAPTSLPGISPTIPMRHFLHRPMLHPPADAGLPRTENGLPFALTLSLPSYVAVDGPTSDILNFGVQIEVGRSSMWTKVRELGGLRLRDMELSCVQTERHCSVPSRTFCHAYPLPVESQAGPFDLPIFSAPPSSSLSGKVLSGSEVRLRRGYDRASVQNHIELLQAGRAPHPSANNVERVRTVIVGPPPQQSRGKEKEAAPRRSMQAQQPQPALSTSALRAEEGDTANQAKAGRGRRAYQSALRGLSNLATAVMDASLDAEGNTLENDLQGARQGLAKKGKKTSDNESNRAALYTFAGTDGHGVDLTRGRVRMAIKLPLVTSSASRARAASTPQLIPDFESPFTKTRHKLQVKLGFGFGNKPLGGEGEWGQSLMMCVPVRFTEAAPKEVREQFAPLPIKRIGVETAQSGAHAVAGTSRTLVDFLSSANEGPNGFEAGGGTPVLPSYNQLFREDGSRLADEGEDLPQYPGARIVPPTGGGVTASSAMHSLDVSRSSSTDSPTQRIHASEASPREYPNNVLASSSSLPMGERSSSLPGLPGIVKAKHLGLPDRLHSFDNRIAPSRVLDESIPAGQQGKISRALQRREMEEMHRDEEQEEIRRLRRFSSRIDVQAGVHVATERLDGAESQEEVSETEEEDAMRMLEETVNMDDENAFDEDDVPAFAAAARRVGSDVNDDDDNHDDDDAGNATLVPIEGHSFAG